MAETFFIADLHFGHERIIELAKRPFTSVNRMNEAMIENWNDVVPRDGTVYVLGDFAHHSVDPLTFFVRLNGTKHLIRGNHDEEATLSMPWVTVSDTLILRIRSTWLHLHHYPLREWQGFFGGAVHLHGHVHGTLQDVSGSMDVGVERIGYQPISISTIEERFSMWKRTGGKRGA